MTWSKWRWAAPLVAHPEIRRNQNPRPSRRSAPRGLAGPHGGHAGPGPARPARGPGLAMPMPIHLQAPAAGGKQKQGKGSIVLPVCAHTPPAFCERPLPKRKHFSLKENTSVNGILCMYWGFLCAVVSRADQRFFLKKKKEIIFDWHKSSEPYTIYLHKQLYIIIYTHDLS